MEFEIKEKKNNPLLKRTEVQFIIKHENEGTPNRKLLLSELAETLNTKQNNIIINCCTSSFGSTISKGYAKVYSSQKQAENVERKYQLKRNKIQGKQKKETEKTEKKEEAKPDKPSKEQKPNEDKDQNKEED